MRKYFAGALFAAFLSPFQAGAVGAFSRACNMAEISPNLLPSVVNLFAMIGMPTSLIDPINNASTAEKGKYWVLESLTADIYAGIPRYYLYSESRAYKRPTGAVVGGSSTFGYALSRSYKSPWTSIELHGDILDQSKMAHLVAVLQLRRLGFYSRAGSDQVVEYFNDTSPGAFVVYGQHYYFDPATKKTTFLPITKSTDCNLGEWGWSWT